MNTCSNEMLLNDEYSISTVGFVPSNIKKSNQLIHSKFKLTTLQQKIFYLALAKIKMDKKSGLAHSEVNVAELKQYTGTKSHAIYTDAKAAAINLATMYILSESENEFQVQSGIIDEVIYKNGTMSFSFGKKYNNLIYDLSNNFTLLNTDIFMSLSTGYCIRLYEILKSETFKSDIVLKKMSIGEVKLSMGMVNINEKMQKVLQKNAHIDKNKLIEEYADKDITWTNLRIAIKNAVDEINEKTDINVTFKPIRTGRGGKTTGVEFTIIAEKALEKEKKKKNKLSEDEIDDLVDEIQDFIEEKIKTKDCKTLLEIADNNIEIIKEKYNILKQSRTEVGNIVGWLIKAIEEDYTNTPENKKEVQKKTNSFNNFSQREYSPEFLDELERKLLAK